ncbi:MAG: hypothetical protein IPI18_19505 [Saprospiraceae bacterium]|nr:hypothetical protein [Saprospiraceae bacterium]
MTRVAMYAPEGVDTVTIFIEKAAPGFESGLNILDHQICIDGNTSINLSFGQDLVDSCRYWLDVVSRSESGPGYEFIITSKITSTDTTLDFLSLLFKYHIPIDKGTYTFNLTTRCPDGLCVTDTIIDSLIVTDVLDFDFYLESPFVCAGGITGLVIHYNNFIDTGFLFTLTWKNATDSGMKVIYPFTYPFDTYIYGTNGIIPGFLMPDYYDFTLSVTGANVCPTSSKTVRLTVGYISKLYVDSSATGNNNGLNWTDAFTSLQDALLFSDCRFDTICVAQGTYYPDTAFYHTLTNNDRNLSFDIPDSTVVLGGFPSGGGNISDRNWVCNKTILCGDIDQSGTLANNSYHVVTTNAVGTHTVVDGFCITGGYADNTGGNGYVKYGAGWLNRGVNGLESSPIIRNCTFTGNETGTAQGGNFGGGAFASWADGGSTNPILINCIMHNNKALRGGAIRTHSGGVYTCNWSLVNSILSGNLATCSSLNTDEGRRWYLQFRIEHFSSNDKHGAFRKSCYSSKTRRCFVQ